MTITATLPGPSTRKLRLHGPLPLLAGLALWGYAALGQAAALNLTAGYPDVDTSLVDATYNAGTDTFHVTNQDLFGNPDPGGGNGVFQYALSSITGGNVDTGTYDINAIIDENGVFTSGTVTLQGQIDGAGGVKDIFSGNIVAQPGNAGIVAGSNVMEFIVSITSANSSLGYSVGSLAGIKLSGLGSGWNFASNFERTGLSGGLNADNFALVPEPSSLALLGIGALVVDETFNRATQVRLLLLEVVWMEPPFDLQRLFDDLAKKLQGLTKYSVTARKKSLVDDLQPEPHPVPLADLDNVRPQ
jgi:hypothetical protein